MVLSYLGITVRHSRLTKILGIQAGAGASFYNLTRLRQFDVSVDLHEGDMDLLHSLITDGHPIIASVDTIDLPEWQESTIHAVVVSGINDLNVFYHDPWFADAPKAAERRQFESAWLYREYVCALIKKDIQ